MSVQSKFVNEVVKLIATHFKGIDYILDHPDDKRIKIITTGNPEMVEVAYDNFYYDYLVNLLPKEKEPNCFSLEYVMSLK